MGKSKNPMPSVLGTFGLLLSPCEQSAVPEQQVIGVYWVIGVFLCLCWVLIPTGNDCETFWDKDHLTNSCYQFNFQSTLSWQEAWNSCEQQGANLLSITEIHEQTYINGEILAACLGTPHLGQSWWRCGHCHCHFVVPAPGLGGGWWGLSRAWGTDSASLVVLAPGLLTGYSSTLWIGLNDLNINGGWQWSDNSPLKYLNWESGETGEVVVVMGPEEHPVTTRDGPMAREVV